MRAQYGGGGLKTSNSLPTRKRTRSAADEEDDEHLRDVWSWITDLPETDV